jgi:hypothetical protein
MLLDDVRDERQENLVTLIEQVGEANVLYVSIMLAIVTIVAVACTCNMVVRLLRGYPPMPESPDIPECNHDDNKTGHCIRRPYCQTEKQCTIAIENQE